MTDFLSDLWWLYDIIVLAILVLCIGLGYYCGFIRTISHVLSYIIAFALASTLATPIANGIYDQWIAPFCETHIAEQLDNYNISGSISDALTSYDINFNTDDIDIYLDDATEALDDIMNETGLSEESLQDGLLKSIDSILGAAYEALPSWMTNALLPTDSLSENPSHLAQSAAVLFTGDSEDISENLTETYIRPIIFSVVKNFVFFILFLLISVLVRVIMRRVSKSLEGHTIGKWNHLLGAVVGCIESAIFLVVLVKIVEIFVKYGANQLPFFQEEIIEKTILFQHIYMR